MTKFFGSDENYVRRKISPTFLSDKITKFYHSRLIIQKLKHSLLHSEIVPFEWYMHIEVIEIRLLLY